MGEVETWEPVTYEDRDACRGKPEVLALLVFLTSRTRELRYVRQEPLFKLSLRDEAMAWSGWSLATFKRRMAQLERLPGVRVVRRRDGGLKGVTTEALELRDEARRRGSPVSPATGNPPNREAHRRAPPGSPVTPAGLTGEPHVLSPVPTSDFPQTPSLPQRAERGSQMSPAGGQTDALGALPVSDPSGSSSGRASPDAAAGAEGSDSAVPPASTLPTTEARIAIVRAALETARAAGRKQAAERFAAQLRELERSA